MSSKVLDEITDHSKLQRLTMLVKGASDVNLCSQSRNCPRIAEMSRTTGISIWDWTHLIDKVYPLVPTISGSDIILTSWASRRFKSPATGVFYQQFIQVNNTENIKVLHFPLRANFICQSLEQPCHRTTPHSPSTENICKFDRKCWPIQTHPIHFHRQTANAIEGRLSKWI